MLNVPTVAGVPTQSVLNGTISLHRSSTSAKVTQIQSHQPHVVQTNVTMALPTVVITPSVLIPVTVTHVHVPKVTLVTVTNAVTPTNVTNMTHAQPTLIASMSALVINAFAMMVSTKRVANASQTVMRTNVPMTTVDAVHTPIAKIFVKVANVFANALIDAIRVGWA